MDIIDSNLDGDSWEKWCDSCYRQRYQDEKFQKVPAIQGGDAGIEGFTKTGLVYQCYCPERNYDDKTLYEKLRDKMTKDIDKLLNPQYIPRLKSYGIKIIKDWHFVTPEYRDPRILIHAATKTQEVIESKRQNPALYDYISDDFDITVKVADDFKKEFSTIIRNDYAKTKINLQVKHIINSNWTNECPSEKVENIRRKVKAVRQSNDDSADDFVEQVVKIYVDYYIKGIEVLKMLRENFPEIYEEVYMLEQACKNEIFIRTRMNSVSSVNQQLFDEITKDFEDKMLKEFDSYFTRASISELKQDMISSWLADCTMEFK
jgi:hypothetical protein